ncbi:Leucine-rich repeat-containing protein 16A [Dufourea novaeangliae]|uniref:Leucine-rich repeat-containing protein 16A n=1 Tax=Dufourea novaeangliae TaxID=178035 RepID=A0A154PJW0_DUFNO|nr:Leucine-rich repeat-containing protein 16A [Dufourea novaeangliae]
MSTRSQLTKDLNESVKALLGKHVKILLKNVVKLETKQDKQENRVLVFSPCRLFLLTAKVPTRLDCHFHYLEITSIESKRANQLSLTVGERYYNFTTTGAGADTTEVDAMIEALHTAIRNIFPTVPLKDFAHKLSLALISNANTILQTIDLSYNTIEDKGASSLCGIIAKLMQGGAHLSGPIGKLPKGLQKLNLAHCGLTGKGISQIAHALSLNRSMPTSLQYLNLSENSLKDDINNLCNFLAQPNSLTHLDLSGTDTTLECLFGALLRGCATNLVHLNVARNSFSSKKTKEIPPSFKQFFTATLSLKYLNISCCKLPLEALKHLLLGLACNESTVGLELDMSGNNLGSMGAHVLESCIHGVRCIASLDISDSNMDVDLAQVVTAVGKNKSIKQLYMGRNTVSMKSKHIAIVMDALVQMLQEDDCVLQALHLPDSRLKSDLYNLINALGSNTCLHTLDISGNQIGDPGARLLAKALQINNHLRTIIYDKNNITLQGYADIVHALEKNCSVRHMPFPIYDLQPCMKTSAEKTEQLAKKIQDLLQRNVTPCKYSHGQAFRLQQGFLLSSTQQMVDRLVVQTQDTIKAIAAESCDANNDINYATGLIQDADNSKQLLPRLHEVLQRRDENNPIELKLHDMANELHKVVTMYLQDSLDAMVKCANEQCPTILQQTVIRGDESESIAVEDDLRNSCKEKNQISSEFIHATITEQAGADIVNRVNELNLAVAAHVSDRITDEVIESLSRSYKNLIGDCDSRTRSSTPDVLRPSAGSMSSGSVIGVTSTVGVSTTLAIGRTSLASEEDCPPETYSLINSIGQCSSDQSPMATPHLSNKRKSLHGRKLRPKSVVDSVEGLSADDIPDLLPPLPKSQAEAISETEHSLTESLDSVSELPNTVSQQLQHLVKSRPRRTKTRAPTRPMLRPDQPMDGLALGEGLDVFFRPTTPTTPLISPTSDDSSLHTFPTDGSPNLSLTSHKSIPPDTDKKPGCSSPMLKTLLEPTPRSRSSDNLEKFSPLVGRRSQGDTPLTASPLARRNTTDNAQNHERILAKSDSNNGTSSNSIVSSSDISKRSTLPITGSGTNSRSSRDSDENGKMLQLTTAGNSSDRDVSLATSVPKDYESRRSLTKKSAVEIDKSASQPLPSLKLRSTGFDLRSPTNGSSTKNNSEASKSPVLKPSTKGNSSTSDGKSNGALSKTKLTPPATAPKPRPWSMATDRKSVENLYSDNILCIIVYLVVIDDSGDALDESTDSGVSGPASLPPTLSASSTASSLSNTSVEKRSVRELAASLNKSKPERKENEHTAPAAWRSVLQRSINQPDAKVTEVPKTVEENQMNYKLRRTSFLRDSNFNYNNNDVVDV